MAYNFYLSSIIDFDCNTYYHVDCQMCCDECLVTS